MEKQVDSVIDALKEKYPEDICSLGYEKPYELLFAVRLSAQCTDERVNKVTPSLFTRFPTLESFAEANVRDVEEIIHSCGFYHAKARDLIGAAKMLLSDFAGRVPDNMEDLLKLPGVGRKTANLVLGDVYNTPGCVVTDTHCIRIAGRLGLTDGTRDPLSCERQLRSILPPDESNAFCHRLVLFGREVCTARSPHCGECCLAVYCKSFIQ